MITVMILDNRVVQKIQVKVMVTIQAVIQIISNLLFGSFKERGEIPLSLFITVSHIYDKITS
jgi:hypothetical protein